MPADVQIDRAVLVAAAAELLMAAITLRDITSSMPRPVLLSCPPDITERLFRHDYQGAFDALPAVVRREARAIVDADPSVQAAREVADRG